MMQAKRLAVPKTVHKGYYRNVGEGFADIANEKNMPAPEKTLLNVGKVSGNDADHNLYCFSDGRANELVVTIYNQIAKNGSLVYLSEKGPDLSAKIHDFFKTLPTDQPSRIFVTLTGGDAFSISPLGRRVQEMLRPYPIYKLTWNTWSWLPHSRAICGSNSYIVKLDLRSGNVKSFATSFNQVKEFACRNDFLELNRKSHSERGKSWLKDWFGSNPEYTAFESRVMDLAQRDPAEYSFTFITPTPIDSGSEKGLVRIFLSYRKGEGLGNIQQLFADPETAFVILKPGVEVELPHGEPVERPPVEQPPVYHPFEVNTLSSGGVRRRKMKADKRVEKPTTEPSDVAKANFTVVESPIFAEQVALLSAFPPAEARLHKSHVENIKNDLKAGRLPSKSVGGFYVRDFPSLSRNRGRGAWRVLIARRENELTLHAIADYHGHDGRKTENWVLWA